MAAQRCSLCAVNFPLGYSNCLICDGVLDRMPNADIHEDWQRIVNDRLATIMPPLTQEQKVANWRLFSALKLGYPVETAEEIAADMTVELARLRVLVNDMGCPLELAARIA